MTWKWFLHLILEVVPGQDQQDQLGPCLSPGSEYATLGSSAALTPHYSDALRGWKDLPAPNMGGASSTTEGRFVPSRKKEGGVHPCTTGQPPGNAIQLGDMAKQGSVRVANIPPRHTPQTVSTV